MKMKTIYAYTCESYKKLARAGLQKLWLKVGETILTAEERVTQQDGTSNPEPLEIQKQWKVPMWLTDKTIHAELNRMGHRFVRPDKHREWLECDVDAVSTAINNLVHGISRPNSYKMRPEQKECVKNAVKHFKNGGDKYLINAIMRYGKTFATYQIIKKLELSRVLVLTYKPAVDQAWKEDLETHIDFEGFEYFHAKEFGRGNPVKLPTHGPGCDVLFASFQDINDMKKNKWRHIRGYHFDMVIIDEQHFGSKTDRAKKTLEKLSYDKLLEVSGTPLKALMSGEYLQEEIFSWSYSDEQKQRRIEKANGWNTEVYRWLPEMLIHTFAVADEVKTNILDHYSEDEGFSMTKMFASDDGVTLNDEASAKLFFDDVFGKTGHKSNSPFRTFAADHSLFVCPPNVKSVSAMSLLIEKHYPEYTVINVAGDNVSSLNKVLDLIDRNDKTITITCGRFNTGVTVKKWDMVVMLDDGKSPESYFQTIFRAKSPDSARGKEKCFVIDYNPSRTLEMVYKYAEIVADKKQSTSDSVREFLDYATIMDHRDNKIVPVDADKVLDFISDSGDYVRSFSAQSMFNWKFIDDHSTDFKGIDPMTIIKFIEQISDNELTKGKNYLSKVKPKRGVIDLDKKEMDELKRKAQNMCAKLPHYMFVIDDEVRTVSDITEYDDPVFKEVVGVTNEVFASMCGTLINESWLNRCIVAYNQHSGLDI